MPHRAREAAAAAAFLAAGIAVTWPRTAYITGRLPQTRDVSSYVWALWWVARQVTHLGIPWFTSHMAAPAGIALGYDTTMPLLGVMMAPVTLIFGPSVSFTLLAIVTPGVASYAMYRAARLWLPSTAGAIAAGTFFGLSAMLTWQDWYHLNIAAGSVFLPLALESAVRLRRDPSARRGVVLGLVIGASALVNQQSAVLAVIMAALAVGPPLLRGPAARFKAVAAGAVTAAVVASPQVIAMLQQALAGGNVVPADQLASTYGQFVASVPGLFAPSPRVASYGLAGLGSIYRSPAPGDALATFGLLLSALAAAGLAARWRQRTAWLLALVWLGCAALALGPVLYVGSREFVPFAHIWHGLRESPVMPYTWFVRIPGLSSFREADRFALAGLAGAALLAGAAVDWLRRHAWPMIIAVAILGAAEAGWSGSGGPSAMPAALPAADRPIAADRSSSIVVDVPFGLRGGITPLYGDPISPSALVIATADGHPRAVSYTSWVPAPTIAAVKSHPFYVGLVAAQDGGTNTAAQIAAARRDLSALRAGWVLVWERRPGGALVRYLSATGFGPGYRADGVWVFRAGAYGS